MDATRTTPLCERMRQELQLPGLSERTRARAMAFCDTLSSLAKPAAAIRSSKRSVASVQ